MRPNAVIQLEAPKLSLNGLHGLKSLDFLSSHVLRIPQTVPFHKQAYPSHISLLHA